MNQAGDVWAAIGFNSDPYMVGSDIIVGYVSPAGVATVTDRFATQYSEPSIDASSQLSAVSGSRNASSSTFSFTRPIASLEANDRDLSAPSLHLVWAYGSHSNGALLKHSDRGVVAGVSFTSDCVDYGLRSGSTLPLSVATSSSYFPIHGLLMVLAFGCLGPLGSIAGAARLSVSKMRPFYSF